MNFFEVVIRNVPLALSYQSEETIPLGSLVKISLGKRSVQGIVFKTAEKPPFNCLSIEKVLLQEVLSPLQRELLEWMSQKYYTPLWKCVSLFIPKIIWDFKMQPKRKDGELINPDDQPLKKPYHDQPLTKEQQAVLDVMASPHHDHIFLLHGITGSGKTEIYLRLIKKNVQEGKQTLVLVPEIALTTELIQYFSEHFPGAISILHSKLTDRQRLQSWYRIFERKTQLILGSRSALFTPWKNLGGIILDEEHEWNYKQEQMPKYHTRTVAEKIVELSLREAPEGGDEAIQSVKDNTHGIASPRTCCGARNDSAFFLLLGSATPSIESYYKAAVTQEYQLLKLTHRANFSSLPPVTIVDLRREYEKKNRTMFSDLLQEAIKKRLENKEQIILFLNKRGASSSVTCRDCGFSPQCKNCDIALTFHQKLKDFEEGGLLCHYCGSYQGMFLTCPKCHSSSIRYLGSGTQKAEEQLKKLFPEIRVLRADKDTTGGRKNFEKIFEAMQEGKADVLLGTQMITKGLDLRKVTLTGVLIADIGLHQPDFRSSERVFQLLTQVAGRSGRHQPGEVIIQTYQPNHPSLQFAKHHDYEGFFQQEIKIREQFFYPPFSKMIQLSFEHKDAKKSEEEARRLFQPLLEITPQKGYPLSKIDLSSHFIPRLHGKYQWNIVIRSENLDDFILPIRAGKNRDLSKGWKIDTDPL